jgi:hypothetical protein
MKIAQIIAALLLSSFVAAAQSGPAKPSVPPALSAIVGEVQRTASSTNTDLGRLQIDKWKIDGSQRQQMQQVAASLKRNIATAIPGLISDVQAAPGSVSKSFKLYHNINVVYEFLNSLTEAAGAYGRKEEYDPLASDAAALDKVRQSLSSYLEQSTISLETQLSQTKAALAQAQAPPPAKEPPKKIIVDNGATTKKTAKTTKKKPTTASTDTTNPPQ